MWRQRERGYRATLQSQSAPEDSADAAEIKTPPTSLIRRQASLTVDVGRGLKKQKGLLSLQPVHGSEALG